MKKTIRLACNCGRFCIEAVGEPIIAAECHCISCREAARRLDALPVSPPIVEANGGVQYALFRKDRVRFTKGADEMREFRLKPDSKTRRVVTACCNTPLFTEFERGHWLSLFSHLWPNDERPKPELRTMTGDRADAAILDDSVPGSGRHALMFFARLAFAWAAMGFRAPAIDVRGKFDA